LNLSGCAPAINDAPQAAIAAGVAAVATNVPVTGHRDARRGASIRPYPFILPPQPPPLPRPLPSVPTTCGEHRHHDIFHGASSAQRGASIMPYPLLYHRRHHRRHHSLPPHHLR
jgi:hypothetical protein